MATITMQRDLVITLKRETLLNVGILSKVHPIPPELSRQIFKDNALEKPTQNVFNHLAYYLVSIIDSQASAALTWPLYDSKTERTYRNELSIFISDYSSKGLLSPVMSSYLVNPGCYKVTFLIFQLSKLAVQRVLLCKMSKSSQKTLYKNMTERYKTESGEFIDSIEKETEIMLSKFSNYLCKRKAMEKVAGMIRKRITDMEEKLVSLKAQEYIDNIVDEYVKHNQLNEESKAEILKVKKVHEPSKFFESWLSELDKELYKMETQWSNKTEPFLTICHSAYENTEALIARQTGEADRKTFMIEYNHKTDEICTKDLQNQVNSEQKYILKNIVKEDRLIFPNLIRAFLVSICYILKSTEIGDEIYRFNEYLDSGRRNYSEMVIAMRNLVERVLKAESRLRPPQLTFNESISVMDCEIPTLPDLSDIKMTQNYHPQVLFDTFTPQNHLSKHQFNLRRKVTGSFTKPLPKSLLITPFHHAPRDDLLHSAISSRISSYDRPNTTQYMHNISVISQVMSRGNETIAECSSGFTKQQICRLLSTKKTSSSKKHKYKTERPEIHIKKGGLFNESNFSNESTSLFRSHSSPNLYENRETKSRTRSRKLSTMKENSPSLLEVSGIAALERDSNHSIPQGVLNIESSHKLDTSNLPIITLNNIQSKGSPEIDLNKEIENVSTNSQISLKNCTDISVEPIAVFQRKSTEAFDNKVETPKSNAQLIKKTSSLEKIINRFKRVRASVLPSDKMEDSNEFRTIVEEKENVNSVNIDVFTANRILLPDLLSPSCSIITQKSSDFDQLGFNDDDVIEKPRKPRESLGTALGVDHTFLEQFDLID